MQKLRTLISASVLLAYSSANGAQRPQDAAICHTPCTHLKEGRVTIFIHGTIFPGLSTLLSRKEKRRGLYHYSANPRRLSGRQRLERALHTASPEEFPIEHFYKYYWSGELTVAARKKAAEELFALLKHHHGPCTLIAHSHGCNVALYLAEFAQKDALGKDALSSEPLFRIERLILLAPPVQEATAHLIHSSVFKRAYSCYSTADLMQIADPQGLHNNSYADSKAPMFSQRTYTTGSHLTQAQILLRGKGPGHRDFIVPEFFGQLPQIIKLLDEVQESGKGAVTINIPFKGQAPHLIENNQGYSSFQSHSNKHLIPEESRKL